MRKSSIIGGHLDVRAIRFNKFRKNQSRFVRIWTPVDYDPNGEPYEVLYMLDGQNLFDKFTASYEMEWCIDETICYYQRNNGHRGFVVVGIDCGDDRMCEYLPPFVSDEVLKEYYDNMTDKEKKKFGSVGNLSARGEYTFEYLFKDVIPFVQENYNVRCDREGRGFGGSSMGGLMSIYAYSKYNNYFSKYVMFSIAFNCLYSVTGTDKYFEEFLENLEIKDDCYVAFSNGGTDFEKDFVPYYEKIYAKFKEKMDPSMISNYYLSREKHNELQWARAFNPAYKMFAKIKDSNQN